MVQWLYYNLYMYMQTDRMYYTYNKICRHSTRRRMNEKREERGEIETRNSNDKSKIVREDWKQKSNDSFTRNYIRECVILVNKHSIDAWTVLYAVAIAIAIAVVPYLIYTWYARTFIVYLYIHISNTSECKCLCVCFKHVCMWNVLFIWIAYYLPIYNNEWKWLTNQLI